MAPAVNDPVSATASNFCALCPKDSTIICAGCNNIKYCSAECQQRDAPQHNTLCSTFKDFQQRLSDHHCRAIYFPTDEPKPRFIWLRIDGGCGFHNVNDDDLAQYVSGSRHGGSAITGHYGISPPRELKTFMCIQHDQNFFGNGQSPNQCFGTMIDSDAAARRRRGHVGHAYKYTDNDEEEAWDELDRQLGAGFPLVVLDLDMASLGPLLAYIKMTTRPLSDS